MVEAINAAKEKINKNIGFFDVYKNIDNYVCSKYLRKATHPLFSDRKYEQTFSNKFNKFRLYSNIGYAHKIFQYKETA